MKLLRDKMDANIVMNAFILAGVLGSALFFTVTLGASRHNQSRYPLGDCRLWRAGKSL
jgi:hypothetical protein